VRATFGIHWFRSPTPEKDVDRVLDVVCQVMGGDFGPSEPRGGFNQPGRFVHTTGAGVYFGREDRGQPIVLDVPGEACEQVTHEQLAAVVPELHGWVTRCDVACDVEPADVATNRLLQMRRAFKRGQCITRIPPTSCRLYVDDDPAGGRTLYVGKPSSDLLIRAYDRRGPLRIEHEWKPSHIDVRDSVANSLRRHGPAGVWRRLAGRCIWPMPWFRELLKGECADEVSAPVAAADLENFITQVGAQLGASLFAFHLLGGTLDQLIRRPAKPNAQQVRRWQAWVAQAPDLGYDPTELRAEVERCRKRG
jgi:hypothetical protein